MSLKTLRSIAAAGAVAFAALATAQSAGLSDASNAKAVREDNISTEAFILASKQARAALRQRDFAKVERLAAQSRVLLASINRDSWDYAREILAESALVQGKPGLALSEVGDRPDIVQPGRLGMTKALALLALGKRAEARAQIAGQFVGTEEDPSPFDIQGPLLWTGWRDGLELGSDTGLRAAALTLRALYSLGGDLGPEVREDLEAAALLAPANPLVLYHLADRLSKDGAHARALAVGLRAQGLAPAAMRKKANDLVTHLRYGVLDHPGA